ncbi:MAG: hypothetical protein FWG04_01055 [Desulfovibrionaceae bacterium]|nr:hypothetical protein [Desulfovibrionaceae bacterium]
MRLGGRSGELFAAFARITAKAFQDDRLLSCPTLSKAPNYGRVLERWLGNEPAEARGGRFFCRIALRYLIANSGHLVFLLLSAVFARILRWKRPAFLQEGSRLALIDSFALLPEIARQGVYTERYLPGLAEEAAAQGYAVVRFHRLYGSRNPVLLWRACRVLAGDLLEAHLFTLSDWLRLVRHCLVYPFSLYRLIRSLAGFGHGTPEAAIREALLDSAGQCVLIGEARRIAAYRLGLLLAGQSGSVRIFSWYENQTLNKALQRGLAQAESTTGKHVPVTGAQLFLWPASLLNNHPDDGEAALGLAPDTVLVNGPYFLPEASRQAYAVGPSLRYGHLFAGIPSENKTGAPLLVLLSYHPEETRRVLALALPLALAKKGPGVVYRFHPATRPEDFADKLPPHPVLSSGPLMDALLSAGAVLGAGSGSLAEAAALGIPVLSATGEPDTPHEGLNYLPDYGRGVLWERVAEPGEVPGALALLAAASGERQEQARVLRDMLFCEPTPESIRQAFAL